MVKLKLGVKLLILVVLAQLCLQPLGVLAQEDSASGQAEVNVEDLNNDKLSPNDGGFFSDDANLTNTDSANATNTTNETNEGGTEAGDAGGDEVDKVNNSSDPSVMSSGSNDQLPVASDKIGENGSFDATQDGQLKIEDGANDSSDSSDSSTSSISSYSTLMRKVNQIMVRLGSPPNGGKVENLEAEREKIRGELKRFIEAEKERLVQINVSEERQNDYFKLLEKQLERIDTKPKGFLEKITDGVKDLIGLSEEDKVKKNFLLENRPEKPASFRFSDDNIKTSKFVFEGDKGLGLEASIKKRVIKFFGLFKIKETQAQPSYYPTLADIEADDNEAVINSDIETLAGELNYNPVEIFNFVRDNITYEPYYGAKKGSVGCLAEKVCNDYDTGSLTIALLRASGIPARYKKSIIEVSTDKLKKMLGVDQVKTAYFALASNQVPVYIVSGNPVPGDLDSADLENETSLGVEWVFTQAFYEYDERGANVSNADRVDEILQTATTSEALNEYLANYPKMQWIPMEPLINRDYVHTEKEIVADTASFNSKTFWQTYFQYQGALSPVEKYRDDLLNSTGKDVADPNYQSIKSFSTSTPFDLLPPKLPYRSGSGTDENGNVISPENWSAIPDDRKAQVVIVLKRSDNNDTILEQTFFGSEINNIGVNLIYEGAEQADKDIIESYGGISQTPASLVYIKPYLEIGAKKIETANTLRIGDSLTLDFKYNLKGKTREENQKFSVAGNEEGIYITLSRVNKNQLIDDESLDPAKKNSYLLLQGNSSLAREYLKQVLDQGDTLKKSLDYEQNIQFSRAVVTQNRVLSRVDGTPTTFDFSGLTLDASAYVSDYSNRGDYKTHRQDFRLLFGQEASYREAELFIEVAGLEAIATVQGLQYAYAHPETYTVYEITQGNENIIDTFDLSDNTKQNMHTDVQAGNTIITPDKFVDKGAFRGILYVSLRPDSTGSYAIGEQAQNGGWAVAYFENLEAGRFRNEGTQDYFIYSDELLTADGIIKNKSCRIAKTTFLDIMNNEGWTPSYGLPCFKETIKFGEVNNQGGTPHTFILTLEAAKFIGQSYNFWETEKNVRVKMNQRQPDQNIKKQSIRSYWGTYAFIKDKKLLMYNPMNRGVYLLEGDIAQKYLSDKKIANEYAPKLLGFPISDKAQAAESFAKTNGDYQSFTNGQIYTKDVRFWFDKTFVVFGGMGEYYNRPDNCRIINNQPPLCGTGGIFGFPNNDPVLNNGVLSQTFEEANIVIVGNGDPYIENQSKESRRYQIKEFARRKLEQTMGEKLDGNPLPREEWITDVEAFTDITDYIAKKRNISTEDFVKDLTLLLVGAETMFQYGINAQFDVDSPFDIQGFSDTGFKFIYNDSHFCTDTSKSLGDYRCISNQLFHSMLGFNEAYFKGKEKADKRTLEHDKNSSTLGYDGRSDEDIWLGFRMADLGQLLKNSSIGKEDVANWILENVADQNYKDMRLSRSEIKEFGKYKKRFRIFEYEQNGNTKNRWYYSHDIKLKKCNDTLIYYQDYDYFFLNNERRNNVTAFWYDGVKKIVFVDSNKLNTEEICSNLDSLAASYGYDLHIGFSNKDDDTSDDYYGKFLIEDYLSKSLNNKPIF